MKNTYCSFATTFPIDFHHLHSRKSASSHWLNRLRRWWCRAMLCAPFVKLPPSNRISSHLWWFLWFIENSIMYSPSSFRTASRRHIFRLPNLMKQKIPLCFSSHALHALGLRCPDSLFRALPNCVRCHKAFTCSDKSRNDVKRFTMAVWSPDAYACSSHKPCNNDGNVIRYLYSYPPLSHNIKRVCRTNRLLEWHRAGSRYSLCAVLIY